MVRWRGVHHVEFAVLDYDNSIAFYDAMFGWLGYTGFSTLDIDYRSTYYMTRFVTPHSYIDIQPARTGDRLRHTDQAVGINHIALWARSRKEVDRFRHEFLSAHGVPVTDEPNEYAQYLARLLRRLLRRPDQRHPLGTGLATESSHPTTRFGRSIAHFVPRPGIGPTGRTPCAVSPGRRCAPCHPGRRESIVSTSVRP